MATFADLEFKPRGNMLSGVRAVCEFDNGYRASVVRGTGTYGSDQGLYELAVMDADGLVYDTPVTDDVLGHLTEDDVTKALGDIESLPARQTIAGIHGITPKLLAGGFYTIRTKSGRKVAASDRTYARVKSARAGRVSL